MKTIPLIVVIFIVLSQLHALHLPLLDYGHGTRKKLQICVAGPDQTPTGFDGHLFQDHEIQEWERQIEKDECCIFRCAMIKAELTNLEGQVTAESVEYLLNKYFPPSLVDKANRTFFPCMEIGINQNFKTLEEDEFCTTYDPFVKCFLTKSTTLCS